MPEHPIISHDGAALHHSDEGRTLSVVLPEKVVADQSTTYLYPVGKDAELDRYFPSSNSSDSSDLSGIEDWINLAVTEKLQKMDLPVERDLADQQLISKLQPMFDALASKVTDGQHLNTDMTKQIHDIMDSAATQSIITNAIARGIGSAVGSSIISAIFKSITTPFEVASDVASTVNDGASAINNATNAVKNVADTVSSISKQIDDTTGALTQQYDNIKERLATIKNRPTISHAPLSDVTVTLLEQPHSNKAKKQKFNETVFGDNSVTMIDVSAQVTLYEVALLNPQMPSFWANSVSNGLLWNNTFATNQNHDWIIQADNAWYDGAGEQQHHAQFQYTCMTARTNVAAAHHIQHQTVNATTAVRVSELPEVSIADFKVGGQINDRTVQSTLNGMLHPANIATLRDIAFKLSEPVYFYDNTLMYAKLMHYALLLRTFEWSQLPAEALPWQAQVNFVNLDDAALPWQNLANPIDQGHIVMVDGFDWQNTGQQNLALLYILSSSGPRLELGDAVHGPISRYCQWPRIPVTVLVHGAAPAVPAPVAVNATTVINFARRLAESRNEQDQLVKGLYCATELMGANVQQFEETAVHKHVLSSHHGVAVHSLPMPRDYNYLARFLNLRPTAPAMTYANEIDAFVSRTPTEIVTAMAIYAASIQTMATTYLAGMNVTTEHLMNRSMLPLVALDPSLLNMLAALNQPVAVPSIANVNSDARFHAFVRCLVNKYFSFTIYEQLWWQTSSFFQSANFAMDVMAATYHNYPAPYAPRRGTFYAMTGLIKQYPVEWAASSRGAHFSIEKETVRVGPVADRGWRAVLGDKNYNESILLNTPYKLNMYGWQVLQCLCNRAWPNAQPAGIATMTHIWQQHLPPTQWVLAGPVADRLPLWNDQAHSFELCTFKSFDWDTSTLYAPRLQAAQNWWLAYSYHDGSRPTAGFDALSRDMGAIVAPIEGYMDLSFLNLNAPMPAPPNRSDLTVASDAPNSSLQPALN